MTHILRKCLQIKSMPSGLQNGCGAFLAADPTIFSRRSAGQTASEQPVWHIPTLPFYNTQHYSSSRLRVSGSHKDIQMEKEEVPGRDSERSEFRESEGYAPRWI